MNNPEKIYKEKNLSIAFWSGKFSNYTVSKGYMDKNQSWQNMKIVLSEKELFHLAEMISEIKRQKKLKENNI